MRGHDEASPGLESRRSPHRFAGELRSIAARLDLPQPTRSRVLLEIAADLEDAYSHHRDRGLADAAARRTALDRFELSDDALQELVTLHAPRLRRLLDGLSQRGRDRVERAALGLLLLFVMALSGWRLSGGELLAHLGASAVPAAAVTLAALGVAGAKAWHLWLTGHHELRSLRRGIGEVLVAGIAGLALGMMGLSFELYRTFGALLEAMPATPVEATPLLLGGLRRVFATASVTLLAALLCCLLWWLLARKVAQIEIAETEYLMSL